MNLNTTEGFQESGPSKELRQYIGTIRVAIPWMNLYIVDPYENTESAKDLALVSGGDGASRSGFSGRGFATGDTVLIASDDDIDGSTGLTGYIVSIVTPEVNDRKEDGTPDTPTPDKRTSPIITKLREIHDKIRVVFGSLFTNTPKVFSQPEDLLSGDIQLQGSEPDHRISVLKHMIRIQCGESCFVELDSLLDRIRVVTSKSEFTGPLKHNQDVSGIGTLAEYKQTALTPEEGNCYTEDNPTPLYRHREISGDLTMGWSTAVSMPDVGQHATTDVYTNHVGYDGRSVISSAMGFELRKTMDISSPVAKKEISGLEMYLNEVQKFESPYNNDTLEAYIRDRSLNLEEEDAFNRSKHDNARVKANPDVWDTTENTRSAEWDNFVTKPDRMEPIGTLPEYGLPEYIEVEDPHTGLKYKYFKSTSGFLQEADGSLVLYDGYGSELRMTRGNIIISSAADTIIRPGRDLHTMAGRHTAVVSQQDVALHSSHKDVYIKAEKSLKTLAGVNQEGSMIFDYRGNEGILIRSNNKAAVVGADVFIGGVLPEDAPDTDKGLVDSLDALEPNGSVTIAASSPVIRGYEVTMFGESACHVGTTNAVMALNDGQAITAAEDIFVSGHIGIGNLSGLVTYNNGAGSLIRIGNQYESKDDFILRIDMPVVATHSVATDFIVARIGNFMDAAANNAKGESGMAVGTDKIRMPDYYSSASKGEFRVTDSGVSVSTTYAGTPKFIFGNSFAYPSSNDLGISVSGNYIIPGIRWQSMLSGTSVWEESPIKSVRGGKDTMVYPGKEAWDKLTVSVKGGESVKLLGGYRING